MSKVAPDGGAMDVKAAEAADGSKGRTVQVAPAPPAAAGEANTAPALTTDALAAHDAAAAKDSTTPGAQSPASSASAPLTNPQMSVIYPDEKALSSQTSIADQLAEDIAKVNELSIEDVFRFRRAKSGNCFYVLYRIIFCLIWFPIGIPILILRIFAIVFFMKGLACLPISVSKSIGSYCSWFLLNVCLSTFQMTTGRSNLKNTPNPKIVVGNHISNLDPIILTATFGDFSVLGHENYIWFWEIMNRIGFLREIVYTDYYSKDGAQKVRDNIERLTSPGVTRPFLLFPEGAVNNCDVALMRYEKYVFSLGLKVCPVATEIINPWPFTHYVAYASAYENIGWMVFLPFTIWHHTILPAMEKEPDESAADFSSRVQKAVADHLRIKCSNDNWAVKDMFFQAAGLMPFTPEIWEKKKTTIQKHRIEIKMRNDKRKRAGKNFKCEGHNNVAEVGKALKDSQAELGSGPENSSRNSSTRSSRIRKFSLR